MKARPYRVEDFRDALIHESVLPEVVALGTFQMNHIWAVTLKNEEAKKLVLAKNEISVKGHRCLIIDPCNQDCRIKLHWVLHNVADDHIKAAFAPYGKVIEITREKWRVDGCASFGTMSRTVVLRLKGGVTLDDLPHQLRIAGELALVAVPGRPPLCLRCHQTGHIRRECRVPKCTVCRRFGHVGENCVKSYAVAAGGTSDHDKWEHIMDEAEAEEALAATKKSEQDPPRAAEGNTTKEDSTSSKAEDTEVTTPTENIVTPPPTGDVANANVAREFDEGSMETDGDTSGAAAKRQRDDGAEAQGAPSSEEPPTKAAAGRGKRRDVKPNVHDGERRPPKPPS